MLLQTSETIGNLPGSSQSFFVLLFTLLLCGVFTYLFIRLIWALIRYFESRIKDD